MREGISEVGETGMGECRLAVMGATGHVGKNIAKGFAQECDLWLFARSTKRLDEFVREELGTTPGIHVAALDQFASGTMRFDGVINCIGHGTPEKIAGHGREVLEVTEHFDNECLRYLDAHPDCVYVNFSSGAIYGTDMAGAVSEKSEFRVDLGELGDGAAYRVSKLHAETKHRCRDGYTIYDLRLFGFFSRYIDLESRYLLSEMIRCVQKATEFITGPVDIVRDYVSPRDLCDLVARCVDHPGNNCSMDVYSREAVTKMQLLKAFEDRYGLRVKIADRASGGSPTGVKNHYASKSDRATRLLGYSPALSSMDAVLSEARALLGS